MKEGEVMVTKRTTRSSSHYYAPMSTLVRSRTPKTLAQMEEERIKQRNFAIGSYGAAVLMCLLFLVLSAGVVMFGW